MINSGTTLILVSHNAEQVKALCSKAIWIDHGKVAAIGDAVEVCAAYQNGG